MACQRLITNLFVNIRCTLKHNPILLTRCFSSLSTFRTNPLNRFSLSSAQVSVNQSRKYAKGKDKLKSSGKKVEIREDLLSEHINTRKFRMELEEAVDLMKEQLIKNVSLRSSSGTIEDLKIELEGEKYAIRDLAQINRKNPKLLVLNFSTFPQAIPVVLQALSESGMNLNPQQDGTSVYVPTPKVTREHRENLARNANVLLNKCKVAVRDIQTKYLKKLDAKKNEGLSKEMFFILRDQVTVIVNQFVSEAEKMKADKIKELLGDG